MRSITTSTLLLLLAVAVPMNGAVFTVSSVADDGYGSLRWAIAQANATAGADVLEFAFNAQTLRPLSPLPPIIKSLQISGNGNTLDGSLAGLSAGLEIDGDNGSISDLSIGNFQGDGIIVRGSGNHLQNLAVGIQSDYSTLAPNALDGIALFGDSNALETSVIGGNRFGVKIAGSHNTVIACQIGATWSSALVNPAAVSVIPNRASGIWIGSAAHDNEIGYEPEVCIPEMCDYGRNLIAGNIGSGILVEGNDNRVVSNSIGRPVATSGSKVVPGAGNGIDGIVITGKRNAILRNSVTLNGDNGITALDLNVLDGNSGFCNGRMLFESGGDGSDLLIPPLMVTAKRPLPPAISAVRYYGYDGLADGTVQAAPGAHLTVQFLKLTDQCNGDRGASGVIGEVAVTADSAGRADFHSALVAGFDSPLIGAVAIDTDRGTTSELSPTVVPVRNPASADVSVTVTSDAPRAAEGQLVTFTVVVNNRGPSTIGTTIVHIPFPSGVAPVAVNATNAGCRLRTFDDCTISFLTPGTSAVIRETLRVSARSGTINYEASLDPRGRIPDPDNSNDAGAVSVPVGPLRQRPGRW